MSVIGGAISEPASDALAERVTGNLGAYVSLIQKVGGMHAAELTGYGLTEARAMMAVANCLLVMAAFHACEAAHLEQREPNPGTWSEAATEAFRKALANMARLDQHNLSRDTS